MFIFIIFCFTDGLQRNDSSMDSLVERDLYTEGGENSPKLFKSHLSPSNLSRDSGLTLSDTQLYDDECGDHNSRLVKCFFFFFYFLFFFFFRLWKKKHSKHRFLEFSMSLSFSRIFFFTKTMT